MTFLYCHFFKIKTWYENFFSIHEIQKEKSLQWVYFSLLINLLIEFKSWNFQNWWMTTNDTYNGKQICHPYFLNCQDYFFFQSIHGGFSQTLFYTILLIFFILAFNSAIKKNWTLAHFSMLPLLLWKTFVELFFTYSPSLVFPHFLIPLGFLILFTKNKLFFLRATLSLLYFWSAYTKFHDSWIVGSYFSSLKYGLPLIPDFLIPWITNAVIGFEIFASWTLLSQNSKVRKGSLILWVLFHIYSAILVGYRYPILCLPLVISLFRSPYKLEYPSFRLKFFPGWIIMALVFLSNSSQWLYKEDQKITLEGVKFHVAMFDANHQCRSERQFIYKDGSTKKIIRNSKGSMGRCNPYYNWFHNWVACNNEAQLSRIEWRFHSSINGGPFYTIVDTPNSCHLKYNIVSHNEWIKTPNSKEAKLFSYPSHNTLGYWDEPNDNAFLHKKKMIFLKPSQVFFDKYKNEIKYFWKTLWFLMLGTIALIALKRIPQRKTKSF